MGKNASALDRLLRAVLGLLWIAGGLFFATGQSIYGWGLALLGLALILTAVIGFCPIYGLTGFSTAPKKK